VEKTPSRTIFVVAFLLWATGVHGAQISWTLPTTYRDGRPLEPSEVRRIVVQVYVGPAPNGPWMAVAASVPGGTTATVPDPPFARTRWYTVKSTLDGAQSDFAAPVRMTGYSVPIRPLAKRLARAAFQRRKFVILAAVLLVLGLTGWLWTRRRRRRGGSL